MGLASCPADLSFLIFGLLRGHTDPAWPKAPATRESRCSQKLLYPGSPVNKDTHGAEHSKGFESIPGARVSLEDAEWTPELPFTARVSRCLACLTAFAENPLLV